MPVRKRWIVGFLWPSVQRSGPRRVSQPRSLQAVGLRCGVPQPSVGASGRLNFPNVEARVRLAPCSTSSNHADRAACHRSGGLRLRRKAAKSPGRAVLPLPSTLAVEESAWPDDSDTTGTMLRFPGQHARCYVRDKGRGRAPTGTQAASVQGTCPLRSVELAAAIFATHAPIFAFVEPRAGRFGLL